MDKEIGHWIYQGHSEEVYSRVFRCSVCFKDSIIYSDKFKYCPFFVGQK